MSNYDTDSATTARTHNGIVEMWQNGRTGHSEPFAVIPVVNGRLPHYHIKKSDAGIVLFVENEDSHSMTYMRQPDDGNTPVSRSAFSLTLQTFGIDVSNEKARFIAIALGFLYGLCLALFRRMTP